MTWKECGKFEDGLMICPYHNWSYAMDGSLKTMPFFRGANGNPGMPSDFDRKKHGLVKLRTTVRGGAIWATYSDETPSFEDFVGEGLPWYDRLFNGKKLKLLGFCRQIVPCNWKFYSDNTHDGYHAALLHTFIPKFGLWRPDGDYHQVPTADGRHIVYHMKYDQDLQNTRNAVTDELKVMKSEYELEDRRIVSRYKDEFGDSSNSAFQVFPSTVIQQFHSSFSVRHMIPKTPTSHELSWNFFGFEDDDEEMIKARIRHSNLVGPSGFISAEDTEIIAQLQPNVNQYASNHVIEMGGRGIEAAHTMISESAIRAFYEFYRREMDL
jgi:anthranilate 1,2-dioxygenase large subunit